MAMTRNQLTFGALLFVALITACGGRSTLKVGVHGIDSGIDGGLVDGKRDAVDADATRASDALAPDDLPIATADVAIADGPRPEVVADGARSDSSPDSRLPPDAGGPPPVDGARGDARGSDGSTGGVDGVPVTLTSLELGPSNPTIAVSVPYTSLVVTAVFSDGTTTNVTASATFTSSDTSVVQISGHTLTGLKAGSATITASYSGRTATTKVTVTAATLASISIDGTKVVSVGQYVLLTASGLFSDGTKQDITAAATWKTSDTGLATVALDSTSAKAKVTGVKAGTVTITATYQGITSTTSVTVTAAALTKVDVTPVQPIMQKGTSREFQATASYADGTTGDVTLQATWTSSDSSVATVTVDSTSVVVRAVAAGTATITATVGASKGTTTVTVTAPTLTAIAVKPATWSPNVGATQAFTASGTYSDGSTADLTISVTWSSTAGTVVAISNAAGSKGQATALAAGTAQVQATLSGVSGSAAVTVSASPLVSIAVTPNPMSVVLGLVSPATATATYENGVTQDVTAQAAWTTGDGAIASVSNAAGSAGQVKGLAAGNTTVTATYLGKSGSASVTVTQATLSSISVTPSSQTVTAGRTQQFIAMGAYSNGAAVDLTTQATWSSSDVTVAQVSNASSSHGLATALVAGTAKITATMGGVSGGATLTVGTPLLASVTISPTAASIDVGRTQTFVATAVYENGTTSRLQGETWSSSNTAIATIESQTSRAVATGVAAGTVTISVSYQGKTDSATLTVTAPAVLVQIAVSPQDPPSILVGASLQFTATAVFSDGSTNDITNAVSWTTSDGRVASIGSVAVRDGGGRPPGGGGNPGLATGVGAGTATITAAYAGTCTVSCTATAKLTVRNPTPTGIAITPVEAQVRVNGTQQFTALLTYDDGTSETLTAGVSWTTSDGTVASITSAGGGGPGGPGGGRGGGGLATGIGAGTAKITATYETFTATAQLTVVAAKPTALVVTPATAEIVVNATQAFVATLVYDDNTTSVVTAQADWASSNVSVATVTSGGGGGPGGGGPGGGGPGGGAGIATGLSVGSTTISASYAGFMGKAGLTVSDPPISYVQVTPTNANLPVGATLQLTATVVFTDYTTRNVTAQATWASSNAAIAVVTGSGAGAGRASALGEGTTTITATYNDVAGSTVLTIAKSVKALSVTPTNPTTVLGVTLPFTATATLSNDTSLLVTASASWVTSNASVATVTAGGIATPAKAGSATITASYLGVSGGSVLTVSAATLSSIHITPSPVSVAKAGSAQLAATGAYSDGSSYDLTQVATWLSSSPTIATVSNASGSQGLLTALATGSTNVTAVFQGVTSTAAAVTVTP
jgi:uncharacterized protein YjdB